MSDYIIYLNAPEYLAQWIKHTFGEPATLLKDSPESRILNECLVKTPKDCQPDTGSNSNVAIVVPFFKAKDPRVYNYLHNTGKKAVLESFRTLLIKNLMEEVGNIDNGSVKITTLIYAWMEKHGIDQEYWYTVSQIYYRTRTKYFEEKGIKI
jgi:hypothetical protein